MSTDLAEIPAKELTENVNHHKLTEDDNRTASRDIIQRLKRYSDIAKLWVNGEAGKEIAERLRMDKAKVSTAINHELPVIAFAARDFLRELEGIGYFSKVSNVKSVSGRGTRTKLESLRGGIWPYSGKVVPKGYMLGDGNKILVDPQKGPALQRVFTGIMAGDIIGLAAKRQGFEPDDVYRILRNPRFWMGDVPDPQGFGGYVSGKHKVLLDAASWKKIQEKRPGRPLGHLAYGFDRKGREEQLDSEKADKIRRVFQERSKRKPVEEIAANLSLTYSLVYRILRNPAYKKIVGAKLWDESQKVHLSSKERIGTRNEVTILSLLPASTGEIMGKTGLSWLAVWQHLDRLRKQGKVDREPGPRGKWQPLIIPINRQKPKRQKQPSALAQPTAS